MPKPIIYIHTTDLGSSDTSTSFVVFNAISLAEEGIEVNLLVINSSTVGSNDIVKEFAQLQELPTNLKIITYKRRGKSKFQFYLFARKFVKEFDSEALVLNSAHGVVPYLFFNKDVRHKYIFETHDFFFDLGIRDDLHQNTMRKKSRIERRYFKKLDALVCLNDHQQKLYRERLPGIKIEVFPTGIYQLPVVSKKKKKRVVYVGSLDWRLGTDHLISLIKQWPKGIELYIVGGKTEKEIDDFRSMIPEVPKELVITGWLSKSEMHEVLMDASIALMPHEDVFFSRYMTVPLKMFDYFAYGLPTLATDLPAISDWINEGEEGYFVDWAQTDQVIELIIDLVENNAKRDQMSDLIIEKASHLLWSERAKNQIHFFEENDLI